MDYIAVNPSPVGEYYITISPRHEWECTHCGTQWSDWGENAEDENLPWEGETSLALTVRSKEHPDMGWCCPACAVRKATFGTLVQFIEDSKMIADAMDYTLTENGEGHIEKTMVDTLWAIMRIGFDEDFREMLRDFVAMEHEYDFRDWVSDNAV